MKKLSRMKKILFSLFLIFSVFSPGLEVSAHELLPKALQEYIQQNPNTSVEEIQSFIETQDESIQERFSGEDNILKIVNNRDSSFLDNAKDYTMLGIKHILSGPDHILFVLSLLLVFLSIRDILRFTGTFTVAHSITILLAGTGVLVLSSKIVEPLIAFSIAYVAITTVFLQKYNVFKNLKSKFAAIFFFGLFHGLGFAGVLEEVSINRDRFVSSLIFFNVGIEIGQLIIIALILPLILFFKDKSWYPKVIQIAAVIIAVLGIFWGFQRIIA